MKVLLCIDNENGWYKDIKEGAIYLEYKQCPNDSGSYRVELKVPHAKSGRSYGTYFKCRFIEVPYSKYLKVICGN